MEPIARDNRVVHVDSGLAGTVVERFRHPSPYLGDVTDRWLAVTWDDGFQCSCPETSVHTVLEDLTWA